MGALNFLDHEFELQDHKNEDTKHAIDLFEHGGELYLRMWVDGRASNNPVMCILTQSQAEAFAKGAAGLSRRIISE